jgi:REP element-mobilizing transposase RayT
LGSIENGEMILSDIGRMTHQCWQEIPAHFPFTRIDEFVVMPNHIHGIIVIDKPFTVETQNLASLQQNELAQFSEQTQNLASLQQNELVQFSEQTQNLASLQQNIVESPKNQFGPQSKNLASIVRGYKIGVKKWATMNNMSFQWQSRFHEHIIRTDENYKN